MGQNREGLDNDPHRFFPKRNASAQYSTAGGVLTSLLAVLGISSRIKQTVQIGWV
jgi:hypothetical protein